VCEAVTPLLPCISRLGMVVLTTLAASTAGATAAAAAVAGAAVARRRRRLSKAQIASSAAGLGSCKAVGEGTVELAPVAECHPQLANGCTVQPDSAPSATPTAAENGCHLQAERVAELEARLQQLEAQREASEAHTKKLEQRLQVERNASTARALHLEQRLEVERSNCAALSLEFEQRLEVSEGRCAKHIRDIHVLQRQLAEAAVHAARQRTTPAAKSPEVELQVASTPLPLSARAEARLRGAPRTVESGLSEDTSETSTVTLRRLHGTRGTKLHEMQPSALSGLNSTAVPKPFSRSVKTTPQVSPKIADRRLSPTTRALCDGPHKASQTSTPKELASNDGGIMVAAGPRATIATLKPELPVAARRNGTHIPVATQSAPVSPTVTESPSTSMRSGRRSLEYLGAAGISKSPRSSRQSLISPRTTLQEGDQALQLQKRRVAPALGLPTSRRST